MQATAGGNLTFLRDNLLYPKDDAERNVPTDAERNVPALTEAALPDFFKALDPIVGRVPAGSNGLIYTPWIWGERAPVDDRTLRAGLYNLSLHNTRADILRAFLEGIALNTRWLLAPVEKFLERKLESIHIVGGGGQSDVWCQIFADGLNVEIRQVKDPIQANARGAAFIAAAGLGEVSFADIPALVDVQQAYTPNPQHRQLYDERFDVFLGIYKQMRAIYHQLNNMNHP